MDRGVQECEDPVQRGGEERNEGGNIGKNS